MRLLQLLVALAACATAVFAAGAGTAGAGAAGAGAGSGADDGDVVALVLFHRHGDRSPGSFMPLDAANNARWPDGAGQLTARGMAQVHALGGALRQRYVLEVPGGRRLRLLNSSSLRTGEWRVRATDFDRTLQSAQALLQGVFPPGSGPAGGLPERLQVTPVRTMPMQLDSVLLGFTPLVCPRIGELKAKAKETAQWRQLALESQSLLRRLEELSGHASLDIGNVSAVLDPLFCEKQHGMDWLKGFREDPGLFDATAVLYRKTLRAQYAFDAEMRRLGGGNMVAQVIARFQRFCGQEPTVPEFPDPSTPFLFDGSATPGVRVSHFSAHDTTLVSLLGALGVFDDDLPPYGSSVVFELRERERGQRGVVAYYNKGVEAPFSSAPLRLCPGREDADGWCPLDEFALAFRDVVPRNFAKECEPQLAGVEPTNADTVTHLASGTRPGPARSSGTGTGVPLLVAGLAFGLLFRICAPKLLNRFQYQQV